MRMLNSTAEVKLKHLPTYLDKIEDRLVSFQGMPSREGGRIVFDFPFGRASFDMGPGRLVLEACSADREGLARVKDLLATAIEVYGKAEAPQIRWAGDLTGETRLPQFREVSVVHVTQLTPLMKRIRFSGEDLGRFAKFGSMHIRVLLPTARVPVPDWPTMGENGLAVWPAEDRKPTSRAYTIRRLNVAEGWFEVDFLVHDGESVGARWAMEAQPGEVIGIMGPVGRPVPLDAEWYVMGCDDTGLPALSRMLETLSPETQGIAFIEVANEAERQEIGNRTGIEVNWIFRNGVAAGHDTRLSEAVLAVEWRPDYRCFGWFAAEGRAAARVRSTWRKERGLGREETLTATYWNLGQAGFMAG
jgi:NADPH-dependent ferric siderophore reductase